MEITTKTSSEKEFPYPIALELRRLNTMEYLEHNDKRLKQILKSSESIIHFLALIALVDLCDHSDKLSKGIPEFFKNKFPSRFIKTTFGKWIEMYRDIVRIFEEEQVKMIVEEMPEFFLKKGKGESEAQKAFNALSALRNRLAHPDSNWTRGDIEKLCIEAEEQLNTIVQNLQFIAEYPLRHVDHITVNYHKYSEPLYNHTFAEVVGTSTAFTAYKKLQPELINSPALILIKSGENDFLNLNPLVILSEEGANKIVDVFLYLDWEPGKKIKYKPVWNGGEFNMLNSRYRSEELKGLYRFWKLFSESGSAANYMKEDTSSLASDASDTEIVHFSFDE
jgi:hypothetical protein